MKPALEHISRSAASAAERVLPGQMRLRIRPFAAVFL